MGTWPYKFGWVPKTGAIKYGLESRGTQTWQEQLWKCQVATINYTPVLSSEGAPEVTNQQLSKENFKEEENLVTVPDCALTPGQTGRMTVDRKITLTLTLASSFGSAHNSLARNNIRRWNRSVDKYVKCYPHFQFLPKMSPAFILRHTSGQFETKHMPFFRDRNYAVGLHPLTNTVTIIYQNKYM
jgi:hypothetical protein